MTNRLVFAVLLATMACSTSSGDATSLAELTSLRDRMCACKDVACADAVNEEVDAFFKRDRERFDSMTADSKKQSTKLQDEQYQCWTKLKHR